MARVILIIGALIFLLACGTTSVIVPTSGLVSVETLPKIAFTSIQIEIKTEVADSEQEVQLLKEFLVKEFQNRGKIIVESRADAKMVATIIHLKKVPKTKRLWWGSLAGKAEAKIDIVFILNNDKAYFTIDTGSAGASSAGDWLSGYGGSTEDMLERSAERIVAEILL